MPYRRYVKRIKFGYARRMRRNPTPTEKILWDIVREKGLGVKIRRQEIILGYIIDFYCASKRLAIELDGNAHDTIYDQKRDDDLLKYGIKTIRFKNKEVLHNRSYVVATIKDYLK